MGVVRNGHPPAAAGHDGLWGSVRCQLAINESFSTSFFFQTPGKKQNNIVIFLFSHLMLSKVFCHPYRNIRASLTLPHVISTHKRVNKEREKNIIYQADIQGGKGKNLKGGVAQQVSPHVPTSQLENNKLAFIHRQKFRCGTQHHTPQSPRGKSLDHQFIR